MFPMTVPFWNVLASMDLPHPPHSLPTKINAGRQGEKDEIFYRSFFIWRRLQPGAMAFNTRNPGRRYQVQMFLQNVLEYDSGDFIFAGEKMLLSDSVRYYVNMFFMKHWDQIKEPDDNISQFIIDNCEIRFTEIIYWIMLYFRESNMW